MKTFKDINKTLYESGYIENKKVLINFLGATKIKNSHKTNFLVFGKQELPIGLLTILLLKGMVRGGFQLLLL
jgi:hypothetical protein